MTRPPAGPWMTAQQAADYAAVSIDTIYDAAGAGRLSGCKTTPGRARSSWRFTATDVDAWLEAGRVGRPPLPSVSPLPPRRHPRRGRYADPPSGDVAAP